MAGPSCSWQARFTLAVALPTPPVFAQASGGKAASGASRERLVVIVDPALFGAANAAFQEDLKRRFAADKKRGRKLLVVEAGDPKVLAGTILGLTAGGAAMPQGIIELGCIPSPDKSSQAFVEVYHYPLGAIARDHLESPEYSFKFASTSAHVGDGTLPGHDRHARRRASPAGRNPVASGDERESVPAARDSQPNSPSGLPGTEGAPDRPGDPAGRGV